MQFEVPEYHGTVTAANAEDQMEKNISVAFLVVSLELVANGLQ